MKKKLCLVVLSLAVMVACSHTAHLYLVQGPLSASAAAQVYAAKITGALNLGDITIVLGSGEVCKGQWQSVHPVSSSNNAAATTTDSSMSSVWDAVYGTGFYVAHVLGAKYYARAVASGNQGTVFNVEMYTPEGGGVGIKGIAKDNKGNIYKLVW